MPINIADEFPTWERMLVGIWRVPDSTFRKGNYRTKAEIDEIMALSMDDTMAMLRGSIKPSHPLQPDNVMESFVIPLLTWKMKRYEDGAV